MNLRRSILPILALVTATATTSACASAGKGSPSSGAAAGGPVTAAPSGAPAGSTTQAATGAQAAPTSAPTKAVASGRPSTRAADPDATSDGYAWKHPCDPGQITTKVTENAPGSHDGVRLVAVTNTGAKACGLSYYPAVVISDSTSAGPNSYPTRFVQPTPPGG